MTLVIKARQNRDRALRAIRDRDAHVAATGFACIRRLRPQ